jgi:lysophospholipase L1-like esterase
MDAVGNAAGYIGQAMGAEADMSVDANGITSIEPSEGSANDVVRVRGTFPAPQPGDRRVLFPRAGGGELVAELTGLGWTNTVIEVRVPEPPGDGPVGFATGSSLSGGAATALIDFGNTLAACLGPRGGALGGKLNSRTPVITPQLPVPTLPGGINIFHGGPVLVSISAPGGSELDAALVVTGLNLRPGDTIYLDSTRCSTMFVSATELRFRPAAMASGRKLLFIGRGYHRSNPIGFELRATLDTTPAPGRVLPDTDVTLRGTGFGSGISATVDGTPARVQVIDTHRINVQVRRPARTPAMADLRFEPVTVEVFDRLVSIGTAPVRVATFRIATFGDSIVWGQGLPPAQRFSMLVADAITARRNGRIAVFALDHCANSGAIIGLAAGLSPNPFVPRGPSVFSGECPDPTQTIRGQVAAWPSRFADQLNEIDLVIVDGGINDVTVRGILDPRGDDTALARLTTIVCGNDMAVLLSEVLTAFPSARVVVTGYYPIVSRESDLDFLIPTLTGLGLLAGVVTGLVGGIAAAFLPIPPVAFGPLGSLAFRAWLQERLVARSAIFATTANAALAGAVAATRSAVPTRGVTLAIPAFGPSNAIFASDTFLFGSALPPGPEDPVAAARVAACPPDPLTTIASIGHPNAKGARAYADAIIAALPSIGL